MKTLLFALLLASTCTATKFQGDTRFTQLLALVEFDPVRTISVWTVADYDFDFDAATQLLTLNQLDIYSLSSPTQEAAPIISFQPTSVTLNIKKIGMIHSTPPTPYVIYGARFDVVEDFSGLDDSLGINMPVYETSPGIFSYQPVMGYGERFYEITADPLDLSKQFWRVGQIYPKHVPEPSTLTVISILVATLLTCWALGRKNRSGK